MTTIISSAWAPNDEELNRYLAKNLGRTISIGGGDLKGFNPGTLVLIKENCPVSWLKGKALMFLGWQRYYERATDWSWDEKWGWDNGGGTTLAISHQLWLWCEKVILLDIGKDYCQVQFESNSFPVENPGPIKWKDRGHIKWVQSIRASKISGGSKLSSVPLTALTKDQIAFEECTPYKTEKLAQRSDLAELERVWTKSVLPTWGNGRVNLAYGSKVVLEREFRSSLFKRHQSGILSWVNWNPKWSPVNAVLRDFSSEAQRKEFREDCYALLADLEGNNLRQWDKML